MMAYRGIYLSYETIRRWCDRFGAALLQSSNLGIIPNNCHLPNTRKDGHFIKAKPWDPF
jgi:hypothetical protein